MYCLVEFNILCKLLPLKLIISLVDCHGKARTFYQFYLSLMYFHVVGRRKLFHVDTKNSSIVIESTFFKTC